MGKKQVRNNQQAPLRGSKTKRMMIIERYIARSKSKLAAGKHRIEVGTTIAKPGAPADVVLKVDDKEVARTTVKRTVPAARGI